MAQTNSDENLGQLQYFILDRSDIKDPTLLSLLNCWDEMHRVLETITKLGILITKIAKISRTRKLILYINGSLALLLFISLILMVIIFYFK